MGCSREEPKHPKLHMNSHKFSQNSVQLRMALSGSGSTGSTYAYGMHMVMLTSMGLMIDQIMSFLFFLFFWNLRIFFPSGNRAGGRIKKSKRPAIRPHHKKKDGQRSPGRMAVMLTA